MNHRHTLNTFDLVMNWLNRWAHPEPEPDPHWEQGWLSDCFMESAAAITGEDWPEAEA